MRPQQMHTGVSPIQTSFSKQAQTYCQQNGQLTPPSAGSSINRPNSNTMEDTFGEGSSETSRQRSTQHSMKDVKMEKNNSPVVSQPSAPKKKRRGRKAKDAQPDAKPDDQDEQ